MLKIETTTKRFITLTSVVAVSGLAMLAACSDDSTSSSTSSTGGTSGSGTSGGTSGSSGTSSGSTGSTSTQKFSCSLNGSCYKCPTSESVGKCAKDGPTAAGCTSAESSFCN
jgi:hypothetical protein